MRIVAPLGFPAGNRFPLTFYRNCKIFVTVIEDDVQRYELNGEQGYSPEFSK